VCSVLIRFEEVVQQHVLVCVTDFARHFRGFVYVAQHIGRRIRPHLDQPAIMQVFAYFHDGLAPQNSVLFLNATAGVTVFYHNTHHVAIRCSSELVFFGDGLFYFVY
jgi:hypothetical protein